MPKTDQNTRQKRIDLVHHYIERNPLGLKQSEIADDLKMHPRSVNNYLRELESQYKIQKVGLLWLPLPYQRVRLRTFELSAEEAMTLYLAARLLVKQHDKRNESAQLALTRLADVLTGDAGVGHEIHQAALELARRPGDDSYSRIFRIVMQSYIYRYKIAITYQPLNGKPFDTILSPYLLEPSAIGYATYVIGHSSIVNDLRTYKIQRIQQATPTRDEYSIPADFPGLDILRSAWSIIHGDELIPVELSFSPKVKERVWETQWHLSQQPPEDDPDKPGWAIWKAQVADLTDLLPWVRSWGADCRVIAPDKLHRELVKETRRLGRLYQVDQSTTTLPVYLLPYAKTDRETGEMHRLLYHLIDVAQVALAMWRYALTDSLRQQVAQALAMDVNAAGRFIAFIVGLHDLGKAGPAYQDKYAPAALKRQLNQAGLKLHGFSDKTPHGIVTTWALIKDELLETILDLDKSFARKIAYAIGGHHGTWPGPGALEHLKDSEGWAEVRRDLIWELQAALQPPIQLTIQLSVTAQNSFLTLLSGLTSVADWVGSIGGYFDYKDEWIPTRRYAQYAQQQAEKALRELGWFGWQPTGQAQTFLEMFPLIQEANAIQQKVIETVTSLEPPTLLILEAPTGIGKTETALYLADTWLQHYHGRGLYVAMPTQATSNQMFDRVITFLRQRYPEDLVNAHLLHGQAHWSDKMQAIELRAIGEDEMGDYGRVAAMAWFKPRKRTLLAPFGVGTVDQTLMSVLQTRHFFVRLFGLSHKVIIFDEVHAYDTYMNTLFQRLLAWLRCIGTSVILLSATLPAKTRGELIEAYVGNRASLDGVAYPALTMASAGDTKPRTIPLPPPDSYTLHLDSILSQAPEAIVDYLRNKLAKGGCAAVICNTVKRAQTVYRAIKDAEIVPADELILFHARFPPIWRQAIEDKVLTKFGKPEKDKPDQRPHKAIVVATQVIEQSLDLDFDLMITDSAPIDLLLQRAGRLHRHLRKNRPAHLPRCLTIIQPEMRDGLPHFKHREDIYEPYILLRTYIALYDKEYIIIPDDTTHFIEAVYGSEQSVHPNSAWQAELERIYRQMRENEREATRKAAKQLVALPDDRRLLRKTNLGLEEEDPDVHQTFRAMTRDIDPGIDIICLHQTSTGLALEPDGSGVIYDPQTRPDTGQTKALLQRAITIRHRPVMNYFLSQKTPPGWKDSTSLRHHRLAVFHKGECLLDGQKYKLKLSREIGLEIIKEAE